MADRRIFTGTISYTRGRPSQNAHVQYNTKRDDIIMHTLSVCLYQYIVSEAIVNATLSQLLHGHA